MACLANVEMCRFVVQQQHVRKPTVGLILVSTQDDLATVCSILQSTVTIMILSELRHTQNAEVAITHDVT